MHIHSDKKKLKQMLATTEEYEQNQAANILQEHIRLFGR